MKSLIIIAITCLFSLNASACYTRSNSLVEVETMAMAALGILDIRKIESSKLLRSNIQMVGNNPKCWDGQRTSAVFKMTYSLEGDRCTGTVLVNRTFVLAVYSADGKLVVPMVNEGSFNILKVPTCQ